YSQRLVNPFRGILSVVETEDADAVSSDGVHWALYIHGETEDVRMSDGSLRDVVLPDIKFGDWSARDGLKRSPVRNVADLDRLDAIGSHLLEAVKRAASDIPFPLRDQDELWLLDRDDRPLALLCVAVNEGERETPQNLSWRPGEIAKARFVSDHELVNADAGRCAGLVVEDLINAACGARPRAQWFWRSSDGSGVGQDGVAIDSAIMGRTLAAGEFPPLLLGTAWAAPRERALIEEFLDWQAPWLLQLQHLSRDARARLEQLAARRPGEVAKCHRLYPEVIDADRLTAARVEAQLRGALDNPTGAEQDAYAVDVTLIPYYRE
ncbi:MAG: hypothetical protein ACLGH6_13670, partial [Gammaproteobacteria bacterium]